MSAPANASKYLRLSSAGADGAVPRALAGITQSGRTPKNQAGTTFSDFRFLPCSPVKPTRQAPTMAPAHWVQSVEKLGSRAGSGEGLYLITSLSKWDENPSVNSLVVLFNISL